ncbi:hypothetical protein J23TS9_17650 [Paenibacillus sp. J23TS9]|uniref:AraC family transcriptional regulator n=1 Tax=Paenibacillus sp. J23TS9 TaxID=2807193 RepID=UPI001B0C54A0|nr:AraC family transcriptional regulator [Paenibacillus sp. J23TS9]GIP26635.1 hypothetical protein J23TS9_17650 [Paenibacillus sp. J23TS9]
MQEYEYEFADFIYYTPAELDKEARIWPVRAGRSLGKPNYKVGPKRIESYSLHFLQEGMIRLEFGDKWIDLQQGDLFCLYPGQTYCYYRLPSDSTLRMNWLALDGERVQPLLEMAGITPERPFRQKAISSRVKEHAEKVIDELEDVVKRNPANALKLQSLVCALMAELMPVTVDSPVAEPSGWIDECMEFMELHASEGISVQQVAAFAGVHRSYFSNMFACQVGMPPLKYLQKIRMVKAKRLLQETDATVTEIALSLGYPNLYSFTRAFKIYYKVSPLIIRKQR